MEQAKYIIYILQITDTIYCWFRTAEVSLTIRMMTYEKINFVKAQDKCGQREKEKGRY